VNLTDPTVFRYWYFTRGYSRDDEVAKRKHQELFYKNLQSCVKWGHPHEETELYVPLKQWTQVYPESLRIAASPDWVDWGDGTAREYEARLLLDTYFIETGTTIDGIHKESIFADEWKNGWEPCEKGTSFLFDAVLLTAESDELPGNATGAETVMNRMIRAYLGRHGDEESERHPNPSVKAVPIPDAGFLGVPQDPHHPVWVALVKKGASGKQQRALRPSPQLVLAWLKAHHQFRLYETSCYPALACPDQHLSERLQVEIVQHRAGSLERLEEQRAKLAKSEWSRATCVGECQEILETIRINLDNIRREIEEAAFYNKQVTSKLEQWLIRPLELYVLQIEADLRYQDIRQKQDEIIIGQIDAAIEIQSAQWHRRITLVLAVFVMFEMIQAFQGGWTELHPLEWTAIGIFIVTFIYLAYRSELVRRFRQREEGAKK
jgi:hypothetical protein